MKALVFDGPRRMTVAEVGVPEPSPGEVALHVLAAGICGSEMHSFLGHSTYRRQGTIFGHELVAAARRDGGSRLVIDPLITCGTCLQCRANRSNVCANRRLLGAEVPGGFAEVVVVPEDNILVLPDEVPAAVGVMTEPLANAVHVIRLLGNVEGQTVAVVGCGPIGLSCMVVALLSGARRAVMFDPVSSRRELAARVGEAMGQGRVEVHPDLREAAGGFELIVDAVGSTGTRSAAIDNAVAGGTIVMIGLHDQASELPVNVAIRKELSLRASFAYVRADFVDALDIVGRLHGALDPMISVRPLEEGEAAMRDLADQPDRSFKVVLRPEGAEHKG